MPKEKQPAQQFWSLRNQTEDEAELLIYGVLGEDEWWDDVGSKRFAQDMQTLRGKNVKIRINSVGGSVFTGQAIYSTMKQHDKKVTVYIDGLAASAASLVAMAGDEVIMPSNAMIMIHNPWTIGMGESKDFRKLADDLDKIRDSILVTYEEKTGMSREELTDLMDEETWLTAAEAKEYGFADTIESSMQVAASIGGGQMTVNGVSFNMDRFKVLPSALVKAAAEKPKQPQPKEEPAGTQSASRTEDVMDIEKLKAEHPDLHKQIMDAGLKKGAEDERARITAINDATLPGQEQLAADAIVSGTSASDFALAVIKAEKEKSSKYLQNRTEDAKDLDDVEQEDIDPVLDGKNSGDSKEAEEAKARAERMAAHANAKRQKKSK